MDGSWKSSRRAGSPGKSCKNRHSYVDLEIHECLMGAVGGTVGFLGAVRAARTVLHFYVFSLC